MIGNTVSVSSAAGDATAGPGGVIFGGTMTNSVISANHVSASSPNATVSGLGGGLLSGGGADTK